VEEGEGSRVRLGREAGPKGREQLGQCGPKTKLKNKWATEFFFNFSTKT
jgi:hypothetical protein